LRAFTQAPDPIGIALLFAEGPTAQEWIELLAPRRRHIAATLQTLTEERERHTAHQRLGPLAIAAIRRGELHLQAELAWYTECEQTLTGHSTQPPTAQPTP
jgi:Virulence activator alpha C-term